MLKILENFLIKIFNSPKESKFNRDFSEHRTFETIRELEKTIPEKSGIKVQKDIAKIASIYEKVYANSKSFIKK